MAGWLLGQFCKLFAPTLHEYKPVAIAWLVGELRALSGFFNFFLAWSIRPLIIFHPDIFDSIRPFIFHFRIDKKALGLQNHTCSNAVGHARYSCSSSRVCYYCYWVSQLFPNWSSSCSMVHRRVEQFNYLPIFRLDEGSRASPEPGLQTVENILGKA